LALSARALFSDNMNATDRHSFCDSLLSNSPHQRDYRRTNYRAPDSAKHPLIEGLIASTIGTIWQEEGHISLDFD
jgi:hypothetical protein